jgi:rhomboid-related protein 1/2/3
VIEVALYIYYVIDDSYHRGVSISAPVPAYSPLIYDPQRRYQAWRYLSYMFIHIGIYHILFNVLTQLVLGIPLEMVHKWYRIAAVYLLGVIAGSLAVSVCDPRVYLAGASGGVYALLAAHVANLIVNWSEMEYAWVRLIILVVVLGSDFGVALYNRLKPATGSSHHTSSPSDSNPTSFVAHLGGFFAGIMLGILVLRNFKKRPWERVVWWISLIGFGILLAFAVFFNAFYGRADNYYYYLPSVYDPFLEPRPATDDSRHSGVIG